MSLRDYTPALEAQVGAWAETQLDPERVQHVRGVVETAARLAEKYAPHESPRVRLAGWIHDAAKNWDDARLLAYAEERGLPVTPAERAVPMLLHGAVSYALAAERFDLDDPILREACALHTTGAPEMSIAARIMFIADLAEPTRTRKHAKKLRTIMYDDLDAALLFAVGSVIRYLVKSQRLIDPRALALHNALVAAGVRVAR